MWTPKYLRPLIETREGGVVARCPLCPWETEVRPLRVEARVLFEADHDAHTATVLQQGGWTQQRPHYSKRYGLRRDLDAGEGVAT